MLESTCFCHLSHSAELLNMTLSVVAATSASKASHVRNFQMQPFPKKKKKKELHIRFSWIEMFYSECSEQTGL